MKASRCDYESAKRFHIFFMSFVLKDHYQRERYSPSLSTLTSKSNMQKPLFARLSTRLSGRYTKNHIPQPIQRKHSTTLIPKLNRSSQQNRIGWVYYTLDSSYAKNHDNPAKFGKQPLYQSCEQRDGISPVLWLLVVYEVCLYVKRCAVCQRLGVRDIWRAR